MALDKESLEELKKLIVERKKRQAVIDIFKRKTVWIPLALILIYVIDNPNIHVLKWISKIFHMFLT